MAGQGSRSYKRKAVNERNRLRYQLAAQTKRERKLGGAQNAGAVRVTGQPDGALHPHSSAAWVPEAGSVVSTLESTAERSVIEAARLAAQDLEVELLLCVAEGR